MTGKEAHGRVLYGRRLGHRLRAGRRELLQDALPKFALTLPVGGRLDPDRLFATPMRACWLEVGFGNGEHLAAQAAAHPDIGCIGCEPFVNGVSMLVQHLVRQDLKNVRVYPDDARDAFDALPDACLGRVFVLFPDPWPKTRHHRRRFVSRENLDKLARVMMDGAELRLATDHQDYGRWMLHQGLAHPDFEWLAERPGDWRDRPADDSPTRYEAKAQAAGRPCLYLRFRRRPRGEQ